MCRERGYSMKKNKLMISFRFFITICAAYGWWGVLYPELTMTPDTYRVVYEEEADDVDYYVQVPTEVVEWEFDNDIYETVLSADRSRLRFRSRLLMKVAACIEQERGINESGE